MLRTPSGRVELAPPALIEDAARLREAMARPAEGFVLIGRRHLRSNNSWMHNLPALAGGTNRCTLRMHPDDAADLGVTDTAVVKGAGGELVVPVELTDGIRRGVLSLPHGWGHDRPGTGQQLAAGQPGVNVNQLNAGLGTVSQNVNALRTELAATRKDANAGTAGAMAMAGMPQAYLPGKSMFAAGAATYEGQTAIAIGLSKISDNGKWVTKITGSANSRGKVGAAVGVGYQW